MPFLRGRQKNNDESHCFAGMPAAVVFCFVLEKVGIVLGGEEIVWVERDVLLR